MAVIELNDVRKEFGDLVAVDGIDLDIEEGEIFGFLGPNGAGKSTTINIILDFTRPTSGSASVFGWDIEQGGLPIRRRTGFLPEGYDVYERLTGRQHIEFAVEAKQAAEDPDELLERVGLEDAGDRKTGGYSKGMAQRLALAIALIGDPDLLILDEPSAGLDPNGAREMLDIISQENDRGATVFFSSHILEHVEAVCDRVAILNDGEIVATNSVEGLRGSLGATGEISFHLDEVTDAALDAIGVLEGVRDVDVAGNAVTVTCPNPHKVDVVTTLARESVTIRNIETSDMSLEELFAAYTRETGASPDGEVANAMTAPGTASTGAGAGSGPGSGSGGSES